MSLALADGFFTTSATWIKHRELSWVLCDDLEQWTWVGRRSQREEMYV